MQTFAKGIIILDYGINMDAYMEHCENKAKPQLNCNGKCGMYKMLEKEEKQDSSSSIQKAEKATEQLICFDDFTILRPIIILPTGQKGVALNSLYAYVHLNALFKPPIVA